MPKKYFEFTIRSLGMEPVAFTPKGNTAYLERKFFNITSSGAAQVSAPILREMAGHNLFGDGIFRLILLHEPIINFCRKRCSVWQCLWVFWRWTSWC